MIYILTYDRSLRATVLLEEFAESETVAADALREELEKKFRDRNDLEIVTLTSASLDMLRTTHSRYFLTGDELVSALERLIV